MLQDVIHSYNHTFHTTLARRPVVANPANSHRLFYRLYEKVNLKELNQREKQMFLNPGTKVRVLKKRKAFNRGYEPNWGEEILTVKTAGHIRGYQMEDMLNEEIKGWFYPQHVHKVKVNPRKRYYIKKILKYREKGSKKEALIKWKGYGKKFNTR